MMHKDIFKYFLIFCLLVTYINRGLFVAAPDSEMSSCEQNGPGEINSLLELFAQWAGISNTDDEDGGSPEYYHFVKVAQPVFCQTFTEILELQKEASIDKKISYPLTEEVPSSVFYCRIDHPPKV